MNQKTFSIEELQHAIQLEPDNPDFLNKLGSAQKADGDFLGAEENYRRALALNPTHAAALYNLGLVLQDLGQEDEAEQQFRRVCELDPNDTDALFHLGHSLSVRGKFNESINIYYKALSIAPDNPYLWLAIGLTYNAVPGQTEEAAQSLRKCITLKHDLAEAHFHLGLICEKLDSLDEAAQCFHTALKFETNPAKTHCRLANIYRSLGRWDGAIMHYRQAVCSSPTLSESDLCDALNNLGTALVKKNQTSDAIHYYQQAVKLQPDSIDLHLNLGTSYSTLGDHERALQTFLEVLRLDPDNAGAKNCLLTEMQKICDWSRFEDLAAHRLRGVYANFSQRVDPFGLFSIPSTAAEQLQAAKNHVHHQLRISNNNASPRFRFERKTASKLRIGYLSADFHDHPTAYLTAELFELHDRQQFEIIGYSYGPSSESSIRKRLVTGFDSFVDIGALSDMEAITKINLDKVDILVDLQGYTQNARTEIAMARPAPIQVNYLGYPGTMGAEFIDYIVTDRFITPPEEEKNYTEKFVVMPNTYQVNDRKRSMGSIPARVTLGLSDASFVFCCFNQNNKILPSIFTVWMKILQETAGSVLWLVGNNPIATKNLQTEAKRRGIEPSRLIFATRAPLDQYLARLSQADLFLDTFPYNAHTTANDALWSGLPVLTCAGKTFASRVAGSLLHTVGLPEMVTYSLQEYEKRAIWLARHPEELNVIRNKLHQNRLTTPLFDTPTYTKNLEAAYLQMWKNYLDGSGPRAITL